MILGRVTHVLQIPESFGRGVEGCSNETPQQVEAVNARASFFGSSFGAADAIADADLGFLR